MNAVQSAKQDILSLATLQAEARTKKGSKKMNQQPFTFVSKVYSVDPSKARNTWQSTAIAYALSQRKLIKIKYKHWKTKENEKRAVQTF